MLPRLVPTESTSNVMKMARFEGTSQLTFTCSKSTRVTLKEGVKYVQS